MQCFCNYSQSTVTLLNTVWLGRGSLFFFTTDSKLFPGGRDGYSAAQRHANIKTCSKLVHAQVNALHFKCALGERIHYVPPTRSSQVAIVILLFLLEFFFFSPFKWNDKRKPKHTDSHFGTNAIETSLERVHNVSMSLSCTVVCTMKFKQVHAHRPQVIRISRVRPANTYKTRLQILKTRDQAATVSLQSDWLRASKLIVNLHWVQFKIVNCTECN